MPPEADWASRVTDGACRPTMGRHLGGRIGGGKRAGSMTTTAGGGRKAAEVERLRARVAELEASERERAELLIENGRLFTELQESNATLTRSEERRVGK